MLSLEGRRVHQGMIRGPVSGGLRRMLGSGATRGHTIYPHCYIGGTWFPPIGWPGSSSVVVRDGGRYGSGGGQSFQTWRVGHLPAEVEFGSRWRREATWCVAVVVVVLRLHPKCLRMILSSARCCCCYVVSSRVTRYLLQSQGTWTTHNRRTFGYRLNRKRVGDEKFTPSVYP